MRGSQPAAQECVRVHTHGSCKDTSTEICTHSWALRIWHINTNGLFLPISCCIGGHLRTSEKCYQINQVVPDKVRKGKEIEPRSNHPNKRSKFVLNICLDDWNEGQFQPGQPRWSQIKKRQRNQGIQLQQKCL